MSKNKKCPFQIDDTVRYTPSDRGLGLDVMAPQEGRLAAGELYRVSEVDRDDYLVANSYLHPGGGIHWSEFSSTLIIPARHRDKAIALPESSYGVTRVTLILMDGRHIHDVYLAWGNEITRIGFRLIATPEDLDFETTDISDLQ